MEDYGGSATAANGWYAVEDDWRRMVGWLVRSGRLLDGGSSSKNGWYTEEDYGGSSAAKGLVGTLWKIMGSRRQRTVGTLWKIIVGSNRGWYTEEDYGGSAAAKGLVGTLWKIIVRLTKECRSGVGGTTAGNYSV